jgi:hypothetical protein
MLLAGALGLGPAVLIVAAMIHERDQQAGPINALLLVGILVALGPIVYLASGWRRPSSQRPVMSALPSPLKSPTLTSTHVTDALQGCAVLRGQNNVQCPCDRRAVNRVLTQNLADREFCPILAVFWKWPSYRWRLLPKERVAI